MAGRRAQFTPTEWLLLRALLEREGERVTVEELAQRIWGEPEARCADRVYALVRRLRMALKRARLPILVWGERGAGYCLEVAGHANPAPVGTSEWVHEYLTRMLDSSGAVRVITVLLDLLLRRPMRHLRRRLRNPRFAIRLALLTVAILWAGVAVLDYYYPFAYRTWLAKQFIGASARKDYRSLYRLLGPEYRAVVPYDKHVAFIDRIAASYPAGRMRLASHVLVSGKGWLEVRGWRQLLRGTPGAYPQVVAVSLTAHPELREVIVGDVTLFMPRQFLRRSHVRPYQAYAGYVNEARLRELWGQAAFETLSRQQRTRERELGERVARARERGLPVP